MSADKNSAVPEAAAEGFFSKSKIGVEEWKIGFQNVKEILDVYKQDKSKIREEVTEKHGDVVEAASSSTPTRDQLKKSRQSLPAGDSLRSQQQWVWREEETQRNG